MSASPIAPLFSRSSALAVSLLLVSAGCGPKKIQGVPITDVQRAEAIASAAGPPPEPPDESPHLVRFRQYDGPAGPVLLTEGRAWAVAPMPTGGGNCSYDKGITISVESYLRRAGNQNVFKLDHWEGCEFASPGTLTLPLDKKPPKVGDLILAEVENSSQYGVVTEVKGGDVTYRIKLLLVKGTTQDAHVKASEVLVVTRQARLGVPAALHENGRHYLATFLSSDQVRTWVMSQGNPQPVKVEASAVHIIDHGKPFKLGAHVLAARTGDLRETEHELEPGVVTGSIDGVILEVQFDTTHGKEYVPIENVALPIVE